MPTLDELHVAYTTAVTRAQETETAFDTADTEEAIDAAREASEEALAEVERTRTNYEARRRAQEATEAAAAALPSQRVERAAEHVTAHLRPEVEVREPDMYGPHGGESFMHDLYMATLKRATAPAEAARIEAHHDYEVRRLAGVQQRAITSGTLGGILPPQYLVDMYAKALRNGRVFADQVNHQTLPDVGMSIVVPRLTVGLSAGVQATENTAVTTSDPTEVDLTVPVRTMAGYSPVSRQALERNQYRDAILFEDLVARYNALLDTQAINGSGASGQMLGLLQTSGIATSTVTTATPAAIWPKIADLIQQINTQTGGLGYVADKIVMHPRRWGMFTAALDTTNRPLYQPSPMTALSGYESFNQMASTGLANAYGYTGAQIQGLPVFTDANIPTNLGGGTNEDRIIVMCSSVVHLWERAGDPLTLSFEQTTGTSLQVNLVAYGYAAFTAGRYPLACGVISSTGLVPPTF